jgi:hypothetical protein
MNCPIPLKVPRQIHLYREIFALVGVKPKGCTFYVTITIDDLDIYYKTTNGTELHFPTIDMAWNFVHSDFKFSVGSIFASYEKLYAKVKSEKEFVDFFLTLKRVVTGYRTSNGLIREFKERQINELFHQTPIPEGYYLYLQAKPCFGPIPYGSYNFKFYFHIKSEFRNVTLRFTPEEIGGLCNLNDKPSQNIFSLNLDDILLLTKQKLASIPHDHKDYDDLRETCRSVIIFIESI